MKKISYICKVKKFKVFMQLTKNFSLEEFTCHDGTPVPLEYIPNVQELTQNLQIIRDTINEPIHIISGYRSKKWNAKVGGAKNSQHLYGKAADITAKEYTPKKLKAVILKLIKEKSITEGGIGLYKNWIHYDIRGIKSRW